MSLLLHQLPLLLCLLLSLSDLGHDLWRGLCVAEPTFVSNIVGGVYNDWVGRESVEIPDREMSSPVFPMDKSECTCVDKIY